MNSLKSGSYCRQIVDGDALEALGTALARMALRRLRPHRPRRRGATLRPGAGTPLWLALVTLIHPHLRRRGNKALLARELGVDPSRITQYFGRRTAMPDAERTLLLLRWLRTPRWKRQGSFSLGLIPRSLLRLGLATWERACPRH